jgi:tetratricopeptide (TPR) repeat protein
VEDDVPFLVNNSGRLSEHAAALLFANLVETPTQGPINVLELGAGTGLFARFFLDTFRAICRQEHRDFYDRLVFYISDRSPRTVEQWQERGQFDGHPTSTVRAGISDALAPDIFRVPATKTCGEQTIELRGVRAVFANYILDVLPATILRKGVDGPEELRIRTHLTDDVGLLAQYTPLSLKEIKELAETNDPEEKARLVPLLSLLEVETAFMPSEQSPLAAYALDGAEELDRVVVNHGAVASVEACLNVLDSAGFILLNDYGPVRPDQVAGHTYSQRFGPTSAIGLNFPLLERYFTTRGNTVEKTEDDEERGIHARLLMPHGLPATIASFHNRFGPSGASFFDGPAQEARKHIAAGRKNDALESFRLALSRSPREWQLLGEIAEFVGLHLQDFQAGRELIRAALEQNPWYSPWLWNVLGDILFMEKNIGGAHEAYLQAQRLHPRDVRTNLNLAYSYSEFGDYPHALGALAAALAGDVRGTYRPRLLEKQNQIVGAISSRWVGEQERLARRAERML